MKKVILSGFLGDDVKICDGRNNSGKFIAFSVGVKDSFKKDAPTTWHSVTANLESYQGMVDYLKKGKRVVVTGNESITTYTAKNGSVGIDIRVFADSIAFDDGYTKKDENGEGNTSATNNAPTSAPASSSTTNNMKMNLPPKPTEAPANNAENGEDDNLPF